MILAATDPTADAVLSWIQVALYLGGFLLMALVIKEKLAKKKPVEVEQPVRVENVQVFPPTPRVDHEALTVRVTALEKEQKEQNNRIAQQYVMLLNEGNLREQRLMEAINNGNKAANERLDGILLNLTKANL